MFLHSEERWFIIIGSRLQKVKPSHNKRQNATTSDWRSNRQTQGSEILQQIRFDLRIQQHMNQRGRQMEGCILNQQGIIQTTSNIFWTMQLARNLSKDDEQCVLGITS